MSSFYSYKELENYFDGRVSKEDYIAWDGDMDTYDDRLEHEVKRIEKEVSDDMLNAIGDVLDGLDDTEMLVLQRSKNLDISSLAMQYLNARVWGIDDDV